MTIAPSIGFNTVPALPLPASKGEPAVHSGQVLSRESLIKPVKAHYAATPPGFVITGRQQVAAYAVIDSLGRNLTDPMGLSVNLRA